jgi:sirohydrochlorin cobaltochelatase
LRLSSAYVLVAHGSRDPRPQLAMEQLAVLLSQKIQQKCPIDCDRSHELKESSVVSGAKVGNLYVKEPSILAVPQLTTPLVEIAYLELAPLSLHERIEQIASHSKNLGVERLEILPLFLLPGVHVKEDIPREIAIARRNLKNEMAIALHPFLGSYSALSEILAQQLESSPDATILLAHGSRRRGGNEFCEAIAARLGAIAAYTLVSPTLEERLTSLTEMGAKRINILPYFLFAGSITDAIAKQVEQLRGAFPHLQLQLGEPLGATTKLADIILKQIEE